MLAPRFLTLFFLFLPINGFASHNPCGGATLAAEDRLHLDSPTARDVFSELPTISFQEYVQWRDNLWEQTKRADAQGDTELVLAHLKVIMSLKRLILVSDVRNPSLVGTLKVGKRYLMEESRQFATLRADQHRSFWDEWQALSIVPSTQIDDLVSVAIHTQSTQQCNECLHKFLLKLKVSPHRKLQILADELANQTD